MRHYDCKNYINLDCEKGMCALLKTIVPIDGENSKACSKFKPADKCGKTANIFPIQTNIGVGKCTGLEKENWAYATMNACTCLGYKSRWMIL